MPVILIVEDDGLIAYGLRQVVEEGTGATVVLVPSILAAYLALAHTEFAFVLLDIDVVDGKTYALARSIDEKDIPFLFTSGTNASYLPDDLKAVEFVSKPYGALEEARIIKRINDALEAKPVVNGTHC